MLARFKVPLFIIIFKERIQIESYILFHYMYNNYLEYD